MIDTQQHTQHTEHTEPQYTKNRIDIPPVFYRDDELPPPPPDDPHWHEWWHNDEDDRLSRWIIYGLPALIIVTAVLHAALLLVVLRLNGAG